MPIGIDRGDLSGESGAESRPARPRSPASRSTAALPASPGPPDDRNPPPTQLTRPALVIIARWTRWVTASDERTCPVCAPLEGQIWRDHDGPQPPLHGNCRCTRVHAFTEVTSR